MAEGREMKQQNESIEWMWNEIKILINRLENRLRHSNVQSYYTTVLLLIAISIMSQGTDTVTILKRKKEGRKRMSMSIALAQSINI